MNSIVNINPELCTGCGACVKICPQKILHLGEDGTARASDESRCDRLRGCERKCPTGAIRIT